MRSRKSIRLHNYDYTQPGAYFITLCINQRECLLGEIRDAKMQTNVIGDLITQTWHSLPQRFSAITLDAFVVMPNHVHGIICIAGGTNCRGAACRAFHEIGTVPNKGAASSAPTVARIDFRRGAACCAPNTPNTTAPTPSLADIIRAFKSISAIATNRLLQREGQPLWQRNYYERIIRNEEEWNRIREYIANNPAQWDEDDENPLRMNDDRPGS